MAIKKYEYKAWFAKGSLHKEIKEVEVMDDGVEHTTKEKDSYELKDPEQANMAKKSVLREFENFLNTENE